jgi:dimethylhistidine N-methyltransferase
MGGPRPGPESSDAPLDLAPALAEFQHEVVAGLGETPRSLPCKYFYDIRGAILFEKICELEEYYPTRTELGILREFGAEMAACVGPEAMLIEYGSGEGLKTLALLEQLERPAAYVPIDIACLQLDSTAERLQERFPGLEVLGVCADYTAEHPIPEPARSPRRRVVFFPGSTIGNFTPAEAEGFLAQVREEVGPGGGLLIGVDLVKDRAILERAYNDGTGVTAAFNLNLLERINRELDADFDLERWRHLALFNAAASRIEMHLVSDGKQTVRIGGLRFEFADQERIHTENSYKYELGAFAALAARARWRVERVWTDSESLFSVQYLVR